MKNSMKKTIPSSLKLCETVSESTDGEGNTIYTVRERTVDASGSAATEIQEVYPVGGNSYSAGDIGVIAGDKESKRFLIPAGGSPCVPVEILLGGTTAREVDFDIAGGMSVPAGSETLPFYEYNVPSPSPGQILPAFRAYNTSLAGFVWVLVWVSHAAYVSQTFGNSKIIHDNITLTFRIGVDAQGNITSASVS